MKTKMLKKLLSLALVATMAVGALSGCGSKPAEESAVEESTNEVVEEEAEVEEEKEPVVLELITNYDPSVDATLTYINEKFTEEYPWITVNVSSVETKQWNDYRTTRLTAGDVDIVAINMFGANVPEFAIGADTPLNAEIASNGLIMDLTGQAFLENFDPVAVRDACSYDGKVYNVPGTRSADTGLFYNKKMFEENGLTEPKTWEEFINVCETLQAAGIAPLTCGMKDSWPAWMLWYSVVLGHEEDPEKLVEQLWSGERAYNDEESLKIWKKIEELGKYMEEDAAVVDNASVVGRFVGGKAAMYNGGTWDAATIATADPEFEFGYFAVPGDEAPADGGDVQLAGKYGGGYGIYSGTAHSEEALLWLEFYSRPEIYQHTVDSMGGISLMPGVNGTDEFMNSLASKTVDFGTEWGMIYYAPAGIGQYAAWGAATNLAVYGGEIETAEELADMANADWEDAMSKVNAQ